MVRSPLPGWIRSPVNENPMTIPNVDVVTSKFESSDRPPEAPVIVIWSGLSVTVNWKPWIAYSFSKLISMDDELILPKVTLIGYVQLPSSIVASLS